MLEIWKQIPGTDLKASSLGRLMIIPYQVPMPNGRGVRTYGGVPTKGQWAKGSGGGRYIYPRRGFKTLKVARLVCEAFHGKPKPGQICIHINENSKDNRPVNLKWSTQKENLNCPKFLKYCKKRTGENNPYIKGKRRTTNE